MAPREINSALRHYVIRGTAPRTRLRMVCVRSGTAMKTPKNASAAAHASSCPVDNSTGPCGGFSSGVSLLHRSPALGVSGVNLLKSRCTQAASL